MSARLIAFYGEYEIIVDILQQNNTSLDALFDNPKS